MRWVVMTDGYDAGSGRLERVSWGFGQVQTHKMVVLIAMYKLKDREYYHRCCGGQNDVIVGGDQPSDAPKIAAPLPPRWV